MDIEQVKQQAQDENTAPKKLAELANSDNKEIRKYVASNPNTPTKTLEKLGQEFPDEITANPIFDLLFLENPESKFVLLSLARSSTTPVEILEKLVTRVNNCDRDIIIALGCNQNIPSIILNKLVNHPSDIARLSMAENLQTSTKVLHELAYNSIFEQEDPDDCIYSAVAINPNTSSATLSFLAETVITTKKSNSLRDYYLIRDIFMHQNTSLDTLELLLKDCNNNIV